MNSNKNNPTKGLERLLPKVDFKIESQEIKGKMLYYENEIKEQYSITKLAKTLHFFNIYSLDNFFINNASNRNTMLYHYKICKKKEGRVRF